MPAHLGLYVPVYVNLRNHPKFKRLCARLFPNPTKQDRAYVLGMLVNLWTWVLEYYPSGELSEATAFEIEDAASWYGDAGVFAAALEDKKIGFLSRLEDGTLVVQSWEDYGGKVIRDKNHNAERQQRFREKSRNRYVTVTSPLRNGGDADADAEETQTRRDENIRDADAEENATSTAPLTISSLYENDLSERERLFITHSIYSMRDGKAKISEQKYKKWRELFPRLNIVSECLKAQEWLENNKDKRKPVSEFEDFLFHWLAREEKSS